MYAIIAFFDKYPLITQKCTEKPNKEHLTIEGLIKLVEIKALKVFLIY